jgi:hypothetical protein
MHPHPSCPCRPRARARTARYRAARPLGEHLFSDSSLAAYGFRPASALFCIQDGCSEGIGPVLPDALAIGPSLPVRLCLPSLLLNPSHPASMKQAGPEGFRTASFSGTLPRAAVRRRLLSALSLSGFREHHRTAIAEAYNA